MNKNVILKFDEENFRSSCIDGYKAVIKKKDIKLEEIKFIRDTLEEVGYDVEYLKLIYDDVLEIQGVIEDIPPVESIYELVKEVKSEEKNLMNIFYNKLKVFDIEISLYISGLY
ncbi:hypothetical protein [Clostridium sp.]|uniref:hypothetical protein n=1 Tax=Clostridium sp. TaxID=1506 RepID=UPI00261FFB82|nr:hypothetical protein [Clostridium sp.]